MKNRKNNKLFLDRLEHYERNAIKWSSYLDHEYKDGDNALVQINIPEGYELWSQISVGKQRSLNGEIFDYIDKNVYPIPTHIPVILSVKGINSKAEQEAFTRQIQEHYYTELMDKKLDLRINAAQSIAMYSIGTALMALYFVLCGRGIGSLFGEILSITATFTLWEAVDFSFLERNSLRRDFHDVGQRAMMTVQFEENNPEES